MNQEERSHIPKEDEFLVELIKNREGYHLFMYPFEGRLVHEVMSALIAYRISKLAPISFSMAMNDYGFELFSDKEIPLNEENLHKILSRENLMTDVISSINSAEMARRKFRDIADFRNGDSELCRKTAFQQISAKFGRSNFQSSRRLRSESFSCKTGLYSF
jgi:ATP-dependent Lhr-like helicase